MDIFTSSAFAAAGMQPSLQGKVEALNRRLDEAPLDGVSLIEAEPATIDEARRVHASDYIDAVLTGEPVELATSCGLGWEPDLARRALASLGAGRDAARAAWRDGASGSLFSGEHHAHSGHGSGYCVFNGTALAAWTFADAGAERVLVVDLDAHCGGGTAAVLGGNEMFRQIDVAVDNFDDYSSSEQFSLFSVDDAGNYLETVELALATVPLGWADAVVYTAGVDPHEYDSHGGLDGITDLMIRTRERILFDWIRSEGVPVAVLVAGGYASFCTTDDNVARLHLMAFEEAAATARVVSR